MQANIPIEIMERERYNDRTCSLATTYDKLYIFLVKTPSEDTYYSVLGKKKLYINITKSVEGPQGKVLPGDRRLQK